MYWELVAVTIGESTTTGDVYATGAITAGLASGLAAGFAETPAITKMVKIV